MYNQLQRRIKRNQAYTNPFPNTNGIIQGCSLRLRIISILFCFWIKQLDHHYPNLTTHTYIDDAKIYTTVDNIEQLEAALQTSVDYDKLEGQEISLEQNNILDYTP